MRYADDTVIIADSSEAPHPNQFPFRYLESWITEDLNPDMKVAAE